MNQESEPLTIDIVSDVVCPWCYLGEKRLKAALAAAPQPVTLRWRPYQLDPTIPAGGLDRAEYMAKKFGAGGRLQSVHDNLTRLGVPGAQEPSALLRAMAQARETMKEPLNTAPVA